MFRTIFVKPENAINIPEKYKRKIETMNQAQEVTPKRKNPIRIRTTPTTTVQPSLQTTTDIPTFSLLETVNISNKVTES